MGTTLVTNESDIDGASWKGNVPFRNVARVSFPRVIELKEWIVLDEWNTAWTDRL
jgi:hypothetical protein